MHPVRIGMVACLPAGVCGDPFQGTTSNFAATASPIQGIYVLLLTDNFAYLDVVAGPCAWCMMPFKVLSN